MATRFDFHPTPIVGVTEIRRRPVGDHRGQFERMFCATELAEIGFADPIRQINRSSTAQRGTIRGLHFQHPPHAEIKLVSCLRGRVFDVAVDLRRGSPTFLKWHAVLLEADQPVSVLLSAGIAHGFQTLTEDCEILYFSSHDYTPAAEGGLNPLDSALDIGWPESVSDISERDRGQPLLDLRFGGIVL